MLTGQSCTLRSWPCDRFFALVCILIFGIRHGFRILICLGPPPVGSCPMRRLIIQRLVTWLPWVWLTPTHPQKPLHGPVYRCHFGICCHQGVATVFKKNSMCYILFFLKKNPKTFSLLKLLWACLLCCGLWLLQTLMSYLIFFCYPLWVRIKPRTSCLLDTFFATERKHRVRKRNPGLSGGPGSWKE